MNALERNYVESIARNALAEDVGSGDITTELVIPEDSHSEARIVARQDGVLAGIKVATAVFAQVDPAVVFDRHLADGEALSPGSIIAELEGPTRAILTAERVALNFLQRMSGIASLTAKFVEQVSGTKARILDTRKTTPGLRALEKYAVTVGGGHNHRFGLYDGILIKDNHVAAAGGVGAPVLAAKQGARSSLPVQVEVDSLAQLEEAINAGADAVLLDNMSPDHIRRAVELAAGRVVVEASGGINLGNVRAIAETGVDQISVGALTHSAPTTDIALEVLPEV